MERLLFALMILSSPALSQQPAEKDYQDKEWGLQLRLPSDVFEADNLRTADGYKMWENTESGVAASVHIEPGPIDDKAAKWSEIYCGKKHADDVKVALQKIKGDESCVYSWLSPGQPPPGLADGTILYAKTIHVPGKVATLFITYPESLKVKYDKLVGPIAKSFSFYSNAPHKEPLSPDAAQKVVAALPEVQAMFEELKKAGVGLSIRREDQETEDYGPGDPGTYQFAVAEDQKDHLVTRYRFEVSAKTGDVFVWEVTCDKRVPLEQWRVARKKASGLDLCDALEPAKK
jgi:hypothetical protein